jgi:hypothetical protein
MIAVVAVFFLAMGAYALVVPGRVLSFFGVHVETVDGRNEVRAVYGGFGIAMGLVLALATHASTLRDGVLVCAAVALLGMAGGRATAALIDGRPGVFPLLFGAIEVTLAVMLLAVR